MRFTGHYGVAFSSSFDSFSPSWSAERKRDAMDDTAVPLL